MFAYTRRPSAHDLVLNAASNKEQMRGVIDKESFFWGHEPIGQTNFGRILAATAFLSLESTEFLSQLINKT